VDSAGNIYVVDNNNHRIQKFISTGKFTAAVGTQGSDPLQFNYPVGIGFNKKNGKLYVCDQENNRVQVLKTNLTHYISFGSSGSENGQLRNPLDIAFDSTGLSAAVGTHGSNPLQFYYPASIGFNKKNGKLYVCDNCHHRIQVLEKNLTHHRSFVSRGSENGQFENIWDLAFDNTGNVYVADYNNHVHSNLHSRWSVPAEVWN